MFSYRDVDANKASPVNVDGNVKCFVVSLKNKLRLEKKGLDVLRRCLLFMQWSVNMRSNWD